MEQEKNGLNQNSDSPLRDLVKMIIGINKTNGLENKDSPVLQAAKEKLATQYLDKIKSLKKMPKPNSPNVANSQKQPPKKVIKESPRKNKGKVM